ncbi:MAG: hypothetical protein PHD81_04230 [Candidatus Nanoarchaeia archaeon]|nr:hypothetical protein [Candidatus Nanoarchaeia archaeon]MDD5588290.1 hypothetical protein [Candidatus Nanoarchaeia archaeon]
MKNPLNLADNLLNKLKENYPRMFLLIPLIIGFAYCWFIIIFSNYLFGLFFKEKSFNLFSFFISILFILLSFYIIFKVIDEILSYFSKKNLKLKNSYLTLSVTLIVFILLIMSVQVRNIYDNVYPLISPVAETRYSESTFVECSSTQNKLIPVIGDTLSCNITLKPKANVSFNELDISLQGQYFNLESNVWNDTAFYTPTNEKQENLSLIKFYIPTFKKEEWIAYHLWVEFKDKKTGDWDRSYFDFTFTTIDNNNYYGRRYEGISLIFILVSLGFFSVFTGVKNLKDIVEGNNK